MLQPYIREIGGKYYCTLCGNEAIEDWPDHGYRRDYICRCEDALAWPEREAKRRQVADKLRRLELIDELTKINMKLGLGKSLQDCGEPSSASTSGEGMGNGLRHSRYNCGRFDDDCPIDEPSTAGCAGCKQWKPK
jgi:hypothetical protein